jgi:hypothetical protein
MLASSLDSNDSPLAQSSRCCVRKLSKNGGMQSLCSRYRSAFDRDFQSLHCFFYFRELRHFASCDMTKKTLAQCTTCSSFLAAKRATLHPGLMEQSSPRSLKHDYDLYVENEIELYKDSISRTALLKIGDEAVASLHSQTQFTMSELLLCDEVDRIIRKRLRIPSYSTWRRKEVKRREELDEFRRPERWGVLPDSALAREVHPPADSRVLVAGPSGASAALYLAAQGCAVTAISSSTNGEAPLRPEEAALLAARVEKVPGSLTDWSPVEPLSAVVCTPAAFAGLTAAQRARVLEVLQSATQDGGVHLVDTIIASRTEPSLSELKKSYKGWTISVLDGTTSRSFVARKAVA